MCLHTFRAEPLREVRPARVLHLAPLCSIISILTHRQVHTHSLTHPTTNTPTHKYTHAHTHAHAHAHTHTQPHTHTHTHTRTNTHARTQTHAHTRYHKRDTPCGVSHWFLKGPKQVLKHGSSYEPASGGGRSRVQGNLARQKLHPPLGPP